MNKLRALLILSIGISACGNAGTENPKTNPEPPKTEASETINTAETKAITPKPAPEITSMERGKKLYARCQTCHTLEDGGKHRVGPNLWGIYGQKAGSRADFNYSKVMKASEVVWTDETIDAYIAKPATFMKGNRMTFIGIKKAEDRAALLEYLQANTRSESPN